MPATLGLEPLSLDPSFVNAEVGECMLRTAADGEPPDACLLDVYLAGKRREDYFVYETAAFPDTTETMYVDACEVYTGPAAEIGGENEFQRCIDNDLSTQCNVPAFVWSGRSTGKTPVANFHSWRDPDSGAEQNANKRRERAEAVFVAASAEITALIDAVNASFVSEPITAELFSAEGDALHQLMDCVFMGPFARFDYGSRGHRGTLPVPSWSRRPHGDPDNSRDFQLPCAGDAMNGDFAAPFTCGSEARRSVIKYFVRNYGGVQGVPSGQCGTDDLNATVQDANRQRIVNVVKRRLTELREAWSDWPSFYCEKRDPVTGARTGERGAEYCTPDDPEAWTPVHLRDWDHATSAEVAEEIFSSAGCFYEKALRDPDVWFRNMHPDEKARYVWSADEADAFAARESSLYHTHKPVIAYDDSELAEPMHGGTVSIWEMCAGLLGNVYFTLPLAENDLGQWVASTLKSSVGDGYNPFLPSATTNLTALEDFVLRVSRDAFHSSPFYRHYAMHHLPSDSAGCPSVAGAHETSARSHYTFRDNSPEGLTEGFLDGVNVTRRGILSGLLGAAPRHACFCGFKMHAPNATDGLPGVHSCELPDAIRQSVSVGENMPASADMDFLRYQIAGVQRGLFYLHQNERVQRTLSILWQDETWDCPDMHMSDQWGFVENASAWIRGEDPPEIDASRLLEVGFGGLRVGTVAHAQDEAVRKLTPRERTGTMNPSDGSPITGHTKCDADRSTMRPESVAAHFVNDLFPASQGVVDSGPGSHCMRYVIELARTNVATLLTSTNTTREQVLASQSVTMNAWRQRCAAQVELLGMCVTTGALDVRNVQHSTLPTHCAFVLDAHGQYSTTRAYMTPSCLVYVYGPPATLHDPCRVYDCTAVGGLPLVLNVVNDVVGNPATRVQYNPRDMVDPGEVRGVWADRLSDHPNSTGTMNETEYDTFLQLVQQWYDDIGRDLPGRITDTSLFRRALLDEENTGVGSPNNAASGGKPLKTATEQPGTQGNTRHCDMMQV
jgi:hypothetical protein